MYPTHLSNAFPSSSSYIWNIPSPDPNFNSGLRAKACGECRRRKVKCDGSLPVCGRCSSAGHEEDCEYALDDGLTRSEMLEQDIELLQARIKELESLPRHERSAYPKMINSSPTLSAMQNPPSRRGTPDILLPEMVHAFFLHASQIGVFLNRARLSEALFSLPQSSLMQLPLHPSYSLFLFRAVFLIGLRLSNPSVSKTYEQTLLARTMQASTAPSQPEYILSNIQAEILLAHYFLIQGRLIEAMDRINAAVSLGIGSALYETSTTGVMSSSQYSPQRDENRQTERVHALMILFVLHKCWGVALQWPPTIPNFAIQIDSFSMGSLNNSNETVALHARLSRLAKVASLYARSSTLSSGVLAANNLQIPSTDAFRELDRALFDFLRAMHPFDYAGTAPMEAKRQHLLTYSIAQVAVIRLYGNLSDIMSVQKCLVAALSVCAELHRIPDISEWRFVDPLIGTLLLPVAQILIRGILSGSNEVGSGPDSLTLALRQVTDAMSVLGRLCPFISERDSSSLWFRDIDRENKVTKW